jgi:hypothetical protein
MTVTTLSNLKGEFGTVQEIRLRAVKSIELQRDQVVRFPYRTVHSITDKDMFPIACYDGNVV